MRRFEDKCVVAKRNASFVLWLMASIPSALMLFVALPVTAAPPSIYFSPADDGIDPGAPPEIPGLEPATLFLYLDGGSTASASDPCHLGTGDEVCGWDIQIAALGALTLVGFVGDGDVVSSISGNTLRFNGGDVIVGTLGPVRLGELTVNGSPDSSVELFASQSINSSLNTETIVASTLVTVPEPNLHIGLLIGSAAILSACRRRATATV